MFVDCSFLMCVSAPCPAKPLPVAACLGRLVTALAARGGSDGRLAPPWRARRGWSSLTTYCSLETSPNASLWLEFPNFFVSLTIIWKSQRRSKNNAYWYIFSGNEILYLYHESCNLCVCMMYNSYTHQSSLCPFSFTLSINLVFRE